MFLNNEKKIEDYGIINPQYKGERYYLEPFEEWVKNDLGIDTEIQNYLERILLSRKIEFIDSKGFFDYFEDIFYRHHIYEEINEEICDQLKKDDGEWTEKECTENEWSYEEYQEALDEKIQQYFNDTNILIIENNVQLIYAINFLLLKSDLLPLKIPYKYYPGIREQIPHEIFHYKKKRQSLYFYDKKIVEQFKCQIKREIEIFDQKWEKLTNLEKVWDLLYTAYNINSWAKYVPDLYNWKQMLLDEIIQYSLKCNYPFYSWGFKMKRFSEWMTYPIILYFEFKDLGQISFHTDYVRKKIPKFKGEWIGERNEYYPFYTSLEDFISPEEMKKEKKYKEQDLFSPNKHLRVAEKMLSDNEVLIMHEKKYDLLEKPYEYDDPIKSPADEKYYLKGGDFIEEHWDSEWTL